MKIAATSRPLPGESHNGDAYLIAKFDEHRHLLDLVLSNPQTAGSNPALDTLELGEEDFALVAVVDGLGHGIEAAEAAGAIVNCLRNNDAFDLVPLVKLCHRSASSTRGAALGVILVDMRRGRFRFVGVGNVRMYVAVPESRPAKSRRISDIPWPGHSGFHAQGFMTNNGIIGYKMPDDLIETDYEYVPGDIIGLCSDGIDGESCFRGIPALNASSTEDLAASILSTFALPDDDATVVVLA